MKRFIWQVALAGIGFVTASNAAVRGQCPCSNAPQVALGAPVGVPFRGSSYSFQPLSPTTSAFYPPPGAIAPSTNYQSQYPGGNLALFYAQPRYFNPGPYYYTPAYSYTPGYYSYYYTPGYFRY